MTAALQGAVLNSYERGVLGTLFSRSMVGTVTVAFSVHVLPYNHTTVYGVTLFETTTVCMVHVCLAITCHMHFWQNDRDHLCATAVTQGWNE